MRPPAALRAEARYARDCSGIAHKWAGGLNSYLFVGTFAALCAALGPGLPAAVSAQDTVAELLEDGHQALQEQEFARARSLFRRAHSARPSAQSAYGLALSASALDDHSEAARKGQAAMLSPVDPLSPEQRARAHQVVSAAMGRVAQLRVTLSPPHAELAVDGEPVSLEGAGILLLPAGRHRLDALAEGYLPATAQIEVRAGQQEQVTVELQPAPGADFGLAEPDAAAEEDGGDFPVVPVILVSTGGALLIAGVVTGLLAVDDEDELRSHCAQAPERCPQRHADLASSAEDLALATNVLWVAGGLITAVGTTWLVLELSEDEDAPRASFDLGPGSAGVRVFGRF